MEEDEIYFEKGTNFFHGSPYLFDRMNDGAYFSNEPALSLAILTEKCSSDGYFYVYQCPTNITLLERDPWIAPVSFWCNRPGDLDKLIAEGKSIDSYLIAQTDNPYCEFLYQQSYNFELKKIYKIDVKQVRIEVQRIAGDRKFLTIEEELDLVKTFIPDIGKISHLYSY